MKTKYLLIGIIIIAAFLRIYQLATIPASLNPDEAALGYNAFSILKTGADEHGKFLPLTLQSFGDWKLAGYSYLSILPIALFGLNEFSVRIVSALAGIAGVYGIYLVSRQLFKRDSVALFAAAFMALSPWNIYFSRGAYEVNVGLTLIIFALLFFLDFVRTRNYRMLSLASVLFGLTLFVYHGCIVFVPLFVLGLIIIYRKDLLTKRSSAILPGLIFFVFILGSYLTTLHGGLNKIQTLNIFNDKNILYNRVEKFRGDTSHDNFVMEHMYTRYLGVTYQLAQNYVGAFNPSFLFDKGGEKLVHNLGFFGNLYLFDALLLLVGLGSLFWYREKALVLLFLIAAIGPIPSIITNDTPNSTRLYMLLPFFILVSAYGADTILHFRLKNTIFATAGKVVLAGLFLLNVIFFLDGYFVHFTPERARFWNYGYKQAVELSQSYPQDSVVMTNPKDFAYIYLLFYTRYNPKEFQKTVVYYPPTDEGFYFVKHFGKYTFLDSIDYSKLTKNALYIDSTRLDDPTHLIRLPNGDPMFGYLVNE